MAGGTQVYIIHEVAHATCYAMAVNKMWTWSISIICKPFYIICSLL